MSVLMRDRTKSTATLLHLSRGFNNSDIDFSNKLVWDPSFTAAIKSTFFWYFSSLDSFQILTSLRINTSFGSKDLMCSISSASNSVRSVWREPRTSKSWKQDWNPTQWSSPKVDWTPFSTPWAVLNSLKGVGLDKAQRIWTIANRNMRSNICPVYFRFEKWSEKCCQGWMPHTRN